MFSSGVVQTFFFNANVNASASIICLILAYALWLPSNDEQERKDTIT